MTSNQFATPALLHGPPPCPHTHGSLHFASAAVLIKCLINDEALEMGKRGGIETAIAAIEGEANGILVWFGEETI